MFCYIVEMWAADFSNATESKRAQKFFNATVSKRARREGLVANYRQILDVLRTPSTVLG